MTAKLELDNYGDMEDIAKFLKSRLMEEGHYFDLWLSGDDDEWILEKDQDEVQLNIWFSYNFEKEWWDAEATAESGEQVFLEKAEHFFGYESTMQTLVDWVLQFVKESEMKFEKQFGREVKLNNIAKQIASEISSENEIKKLPEDVASELHSFVKRVNGWKRDEKPVIDKTKHGIDIYMGVQLAENLNSKETYQKYKRLFENWIKERSWEDKIKEWYIDGGEKNWATFFVILKGE